MLRVSGALLVSVAAHAAVYAAATRVPAPVFERTAPPAVVDFEVTEPEPVVEVPSPEPAEPAPEPEHSEPAPAAAPAAPTPVAPPPTAEPAAAPAPVDLTGVTLTNTTGNGGFATETGNGRSSSAPIAVGRGAPAIPAATVAPPAPAGPRIVAVGDLSRRPVPPNLNDSLRRHYPESARRLGIEGKAVVRARIGPTGRLDRVRVVSSSEPAFGAACERTLRGTQWSPPLDASGQAVHTEITYVCRFRVDG